MPYIERAFQEAREGRPATKPGREAVGRSRGGLTARIRLAADLRCRPIARLASCGRPPAFGAGRPSAPGGTRSAAPWNAASAS